MKKEAEWREKGSDWKDSPWVKYYEALTNSKEWKELQNAKLSYFHMKFPGAKEFNSFLMNGRISPFEQYSTESPTAPNKELNRFKTNDDVTATNYRLVSLTIGIA